MSTKLDQLVSHIEARHTVLLFGAGSSIPSGAPSVQKLIEHFRKEFHIPGDNYTLAETASLAVLKTSRARVIREMRKLIANLAPTGGIRNLPQYNWKSIFTTNYDNIIEQVYDARRKSLRVYDSNFSFVADNEDYDCHLFKIHGTIEKDSSDGHNSQIILTESDNEQTYDYREQLYDRMKGDIAGSNLIIIGHSLSDPDIKEIVNRAATLNAKILSPAKVCLLMYVEDESRASLWEQRGVTVCFGGIDEFFVAMARAHTPPSSCYAPADDPLRKAHGLLPVTLDVEHAIAQASDIGSMFFGCPAKYADIEAGFTFRRNVVNLIVDFFDKESSLCATILGASGVGKTTAARQALYFFCKKGFKCWEHKEDHALSVTNWRAVAHDLMQDEMVGILLVDDAHRHLQELNDLVDKLVEDDNAHLKIVIVSSRNHWGPRIKTPNMFKFGTSIFMSKLEEDEIDQLLILLDQSQEIRALVGNQFSGFSKPERRRRLMVRCEADMFVCMKNIFANDSFDNIVLQEFAEINTASQEVYRYVAAMEAAGVRVHRQLIIRTLGIAARNIEATLQNLEDIISEYSIDENLGIYGWRCRHPVIASIVTKYKFQDIDKFIVLLERVIDNISPTYDIEIRSLRELCNMETGIARIPEIAEQNRLLRKMMSNAPGERVPRHRLIRNLIEQDEFEKAETEIRIFEKDFGADGPVVRYKLKLKVGRAVRTPGIMEEDRIAILDQAYELACSAVRRHSNNKNILSAFADLGIEYYKKTGRATYYDEAIAKLQLAEEQLADPEISKIIRRFNHRMLGQSGSNVIEEESA
jgi:hypothetical protein